jgi:hypothetical protein
MSFTITSTEVLADRNSCGDQNKVKAILSEGGEMTLSDVTDYTSDQCIQVNSTRWGRYNNSSKISGALPPMRPDVNMALGKILEKIMDARRYKSSYEMPGKSGLEDTPWKFLHAVGGDFHIAFGATGSGYSNSEVFRGPQGKKSSRAAMDIFLELAMIAEEDILWNKPDGDLMTGRQPAGTDERMFDVSQRSFKLEVSFPGVAEKPEVYTRPDESSSMKPPPRSEALDGMHSEGHTVLAPNGAIRKTAGKRDSLKEQLEQLFFEPPSVYR